MSGRRSEHDRATIADMVEEVEKLKRLGPLPYAIAMHPSDVGMVRVGVPLAGDGFRNVPALGVLVVSDASVRIGHPLLLSREEYDWRVRALNREPNQ